MCVVLNSCENKLKILCYGTTKSYLFIYSEKCVARVVKVIQNWVRKSLDTLKYGQAKSEDYLFEA